MSISRQQAPAAVTAPAVAGNKRLPAELDWLLLVTVVLAFARWNYFIQDDAFISLRYARNLARGHGLVWSAGSDEYGYTNFLFTVLEAFLLKMGLSGETAAALLTVPSSVGAVMLAFAITRQLNGSRLVAWAVGLSIATHTSFSAYASGGLETSMQTFLVMLTYWLVWRSSDRPTLLSAASTGLAAAAAMLCRLDSVLLLIPAMLWPWCRAARRWQHGWRPVRSDAAAILLVAAVPIVATLLLLAWSRAYYGHALPNTFYAKAVGQGWALGFGLYYLETFLRAQGGFAAAFALMTLVSFGVSRSAGVRHDPMLLVLGLSIAAWLAYLLYVGGDFMEFRMLVPIIPLYTLLGFSIIGTLPGRAGGRAVALFLVLALAANLYHRINYPGYRARIESIPALHANMTRPYTGWVEAGQLLHALFYTGSSDDVLIATTAAGAIPYFSDLPTIDQLGLNDRYVAKHGRYRPSARPGHRRVATLEYLRARGVNLIVGHPGFACNGEPGESTYPALPMLLMPMPSGVCSLKGYYLKPHRRLDALIAEGVIDVAETVRAVANPNGTSSSTSVDAQGSARVVPAETQ